MRELEAKMRAAGQRLHAKFLHLPRFRSGSTARRIEQQRANDTPAPPPATPKKAPAPPTHAPPTMTGRMGKYKSRKRVGDHWVYDYGHIAQGHGNKGELPPKIAGMEGPTRFPNGRVLYYDPKENGGSYYDHSQDLYLSNKEVEHIIMGTSKPGRLPAAPKDLRGPMTGHMGKYKSRNGNLSKAMHSFTRQQEATALPKRYLLDYLCSFIEEAYEHESREPEHKGKQGDPAYFARAVMNELVQCLPSNPNLMRAAKQYKVTQDVVERLLVGKGIMRPSSDAMHTDSDGMTAMGAPLLAESEPMAYSQQRPWVQGEPEGPAGLGLTASSNVDVAHLIEDDSQDPARALRMRKGVELRDLWGASPIRANATVRDDCPVHGSPDLYKSMNLFNPMAPCTCSGEPNPYG